MLLPVVVPWQAPNEGGVAAVGVVLDPLGVEAAHGAVEVRDVLALVVPIAVDAVAENEIYFIADLKLFIYILARRQTNKSEKNVNS